MGLFSVIGKQLQHPKGVLGKALFGWMTTRRLRTLIGLRT
jgi:purine-cytosine permease-like protein